MNAIMPPPGLYSICLTGRHGNPSAAGKLPRRKGTYALLMHLKKASQLVIGRLGQCLFCAGWYAYVGSAFGPGGLRARIQHHLGDSSNPRWHIDYLTRVVVPSEVWVTVNPERWEHRLAQWFQCLDGSGMPLPGFGCSDCRCRSHLFEFEDKPRLSSLTSKAGGE